MPSCRSKKTSIKRKGSTALAIDCIMLKRIAALLPYYTFAFFSAIALLLQPPLFSALLITHITKFAKCGGTLASKGGTC